MFKIVLHVYRAQRREEIKAISLSISLSVCVKKSAVAIATNQEELIVKGLRNACCPLARGEKTKIATFSN